MVLIRGRFNRNVSPFVHHIPDIYELFKVLDSLKTTTPAMEVTT